MNTRTPQYLNAIPIYPRAYTSGNTIQREKSSFDSAEQIELAMVKADQLQQKLEVINKHINSKITRRGYQGF
jgi:hypothetical protein